jgi:hypothetical protein
VAGALAFIVTSLAAPADSNGIAIGLCAAARRLTAKCHCCTKAPQALGSMFLICRNLTRHRRSAIKRQMRDRHKERPEVILAAESQFAHDPSLVARVVDPDDLAPSQYIFSPRSFSKNLRQARGGRGWQRQALSQFDDEAFDLIGIVYHGRRLGL